MVGDGPPHLLGMGLIYTHYRESHDKQEQIIYALGNPGLNSMPQVTCVYHPCLGKDLKNPHPIEKVYMYN